MYCILTCLVWQFKHIRLHVDQVMIKLRVQNAKGVLITHVAPEYNKSQIKIYCTLLYSSEKKNAILAMYY